MSWLTFVRTIAGQISPGQVAVSEDEPLPVKVMSGGGGGASADRELVVTTYRCKTAFAGAAVGDAITATQVLDVSGVPFTVSTVWRNQTQAADLAGAPSAANIEVRGAQALTDAQLRATPLPTTPLRKLGVARNIAVGAANAEQALTPTCTAVTMTLVGCNARIKITTAGTDAAATDHRVLDGERIDLAVDAGSTVAVIGDGGTGTLAISELV